MKCQGKCQSFQVIQSALALALAVLGLFLMNDVVAGMPMPGSSLELYLAEPLLPLIPITQPISAQKAVARLKFNFSVTPYMTESAAEISYWVLNPFDVISTTTGLSGMPQGVVQISQMPGDCASSFQLPPHAGCRLHFYVDKGTYVSLQGGNGPVVSANMNWVLKDKHGQRSGNINTTTSPHPLQNIAAALAPIMLPTEAIVTPNAQDGLFYDEASHSIVGTPTRTGEYHFSVRATNGQAIADPQDLSIIVAPNPHDTPVFKSHDSLASAMPEQDYRLDLLTFIEPTPGFMLTNQIHFRIDSDRFGSPWLSVDKENQTRLQGHPLSSDAGLIKEITVIASSNTGGDSKPFTIRIPVAYDEKKKPRIKQNIPLTGEAGAPFHHDFHLDIVDPAADGSIRLMLDKIEPAAPWLSLDTVVLDGMVPPDAVGFRYQLTFHANTAAGGDSDPVTVPLQIAIDEKRTPRFYSAKPTLPLFYVGQSYLYDFAESHDVYPEYKDAPYTIELAPGCNHLSWLRIQDNKLIADSVPDHLEAKQELLVTIKNIPGGRSKTLPITLFVMN